MYKIKFEENEFTCNEDQTVLAAARRQMVKIPYGCANGGCGMCKMYVVEGEYELLTYSKGELPDDERDDGYILACKTVPLDDMEVELPD